MLREKLYNGRCVAHKIQHVIYNNWIEANIMVCISNYKFIYI